MLLLPFELPPGTGRGPLVLVMILEKENLDRMKLADPFDLKMGVLPAPFRHRRVNVSDIDLVIAYEEDTNTLMGFRERQDIAGLMTWLERGRKIAPGDLHAPVPLRRN